jgi:tetratricopeptide (TPR) repeat protein
MVHNIEARRDVAPLVLRAFDSARLSGEPLLLAEFNREKATHLAWLGDHRRSAEVAEEALQTFRALDDPVGEANTLRSLAGLMMTTHDYPSAMQYSTQAVAAAQRSGQRDILAVALTQQAAALAEAGRWQETLLASTTAMELVQELGLEYLQATLWRALGLASRHLGEPTAALDHFLRVLALSDTQWDAGGRLDVQMLVAETALATGDHGLARTHLQLATEFAATLTMPLVDVFPDRQTAEIWPTRVSTVAAALADGPPR